MSTTEMMTTCRLLCEKIDAAAENLAVREKALNADYDKRLADSTADLRKNATQSAIQLADANHQVKEVQWQRDQARSERDSALKEVEQWKERHAAHRGVGNR